MIETTKTTIPPDELRLAQLACAKLAELVQGTLSIGLPALVTGVPNPQVFLEDQFRVLTAFAEVLHVVSGKPGNQEEILRLRYRSGAVASGLEHLRRRLMECLDPSQTLPLTLETARHSASALCDAIAGYGDLIQLDRSRIEKVKCVVVEVFDGVGNMTEVAEPSAG